MGYQKAMGERWTSYLLFSVLIAILGGFLFGYHTAVISGALIFLSDTFHLSLLDHGMVVSILLVGSVVGSVVAGAMADWLGRKKTLLVSALLFILGSCLLALSRTYAEVLIGRGVSGVAVGIVSLAAPLYLAEIAPPRVRGTLVSLYQLAITVGILLSFIVDYLFSFSGNWRLMFLLGALPALVQALCLPLLSETPPWLLKRGLESQAIALLQRLRQGKNWMNQIESMRSAANPHRAGTWKSLLSPKMRFVLLIGFFLSAFQQITGINTVIYYAPTIFDFAGFNSTSSAIAASVWIGIINVIATIIAVWLLDRVGRRLLLLIGSAGMALSLICLSLAFFFASSWTVGVSVASLMVYVGFFAIGLGPVTWVLISEIYPMRVRSRAMTTSVVANWGCNYLVALTFLGLFEALGPQGTFLLYALICLICLWFVWRFIPETRGKSLEEIESIIFH